MEVNKELIIELLRSDGYLAVNKRLLSKIGPINAIVLSNYVDKYQYCKEYHLDEDDWFYLTHSQQSVQLGLARYSVVESKNFLIRSDILLTKRQGMPSKEYYKINFETVYSLLFTDTPTPTAETNYKGQATKTPRGLATKTPEGQHLLYVYKNIYIKENSQNLEQKSDTPIPKRSTPKAERNIIPPKLAWVESYSRERGSKIDPQQFYDWHTAKGWKIGSAPMKDWQAAFRTWECRERRECGEKATKGKRPFIIDDGIRYDLRPDGFYYHGRTGKRYIE
jgi:hypothetical protein